MKRYFSSGWARLCMLSLLAATLVGTPSALATHGVPTEVTVGSNDNVFSQNKQNEPAVAIDANHPSVLAAGANDNIDMEGCNAGDPRTCPFTDGVGGSGISFSFDAGDTWMQPTYTGWTARHCVVPPGTACSPAFGPIGTLPWYFENGLVSDGDPAVSFGPKPDASGHFSWANGSRLYYANLTSNFSSARGEQEFRGDEAIAVSRIDGNPLTPAIVANKNSWMPPVIASRRQSNTAFADKEQIWADNAASSPFFGTVYLCYAEFRSRGSHQNANAPVPLVVLVSRDGGSTWEKDQLSPAGTDPHSRNATGFGLSGCTVRTASNGVAYIFAERFAAPFTLPTHSEHVMFKSTNGGRNWTHAIHTQDVVDPCYVVDPVIGRCVEDGIAGARNDLAASPSVDIANGAPTGAGATNEIVDAWADGGTALNSEPVKLSYSTNGGSSWSAPASIQNGGHRGYYAAPALSPNGTDLYVVYNAFTTPFRTDTTSARSLIAAVKHADIGPGGAPTGWSTLHTTPPGDPRGSSQNNLAAEFLGDYVYAAATRTYGAAVWNDARNAAVCPAINAYWAALRGGPAAPRPAPQVDCPPTWGNTDIFGGSWADPTP
jgi:hypothetical protein